MFRFDIAIACRQSPACLKELALLAEPDSRSEPFLTLEMGGKCYYSWNLCERMKFFKRILRSRVLITKIMSILGGAP